MEVRCMRGFLFEAKAQKKTATVSGVNVLPLDLSSTIVRENCTQQWTREGAP
jgi:hypothetical protein